MIIINLTKKGVHFNFGAILDSSHAEEKTSLVCHCIIPLRPHALVCSISSSGLSAAADRCWPLVNADVRLWATVQTGCDLPSSAGIRLIFSLIHSNCGACIEVRFYCYSLLHCDLAEIPPASKTNTYYCT